MKEFHETKPKSDLNEKDLAVLDSLAAKTSSSLYMYKTYSFTRKLDNFSDNNDLFPLQWPQNPRLSRGGPVDKWVFKLQGKVRFFINKSGNSRDFSSM